MAVLPGSVCGCARGHMHTQVFGMVGMGGVVVSKSYETLNWFMFPVVLGWKRLASVSDGEANDLTTSRLQILFSVPRHPAAHLKTRYSVGCISKNNWQSMCSKGESYLGDSGVIIKQAYAQKWSIGIELIP